MSDKPKPLKVEESEVKPVELPDKGTQYGPEKEREETEQDITVDTRDRPEKRRSLREQQKEDRKMRAQIKKMTQQMARPLRHRDMQLIVNQVSMALRPMLTKMQDDLDKLAYLPDYLSDCLSEEQLGDLKGFKADAIPSIAGFDDWIKELKAKLEAIEDAVDPASLQKKVGGSPVTEET